MTEEAPSHILAAILYVELEGMRALEPVGRNREALRRMIGAEIRVRLNPCPTIVAPGISAAPGSLP